MFIRHFHRIVYKISDLPIGSLSSLQQRKILYVVIKILFLKRTFYLEISGFASGKYISKDSCGAKEDDLERFLLSCLADIAINDPSYSKNKQNSWDIQKMVL